MKEASGEFSMTLIVIIGAIIIVTILTTFLKPAATNFIKDQWNSMTEKADQD